MSQCLRHFPMKYFLIQFFNYLVIFIHSCRTSCPISDYPTIFSAHSDSLIALQLFLASSDTQLCTVLWVLLGRFSIFSFNCVNRVPQHIVQNASSLFLSCQLQRSILILDAVCICYLNSYNYPLVVQCIRYLGRLQLLVPTCLELLGSVQCTALVP